MHQYLSISKRDANLVAIVAVYLERMFAKCEIGKKLSQSPNHNTDQGKDSEYLI
ncbi:hypothetical protein Anacy_4587 [Anabaena cylindrica PCC 7122]|uniref:Uncharacterized protein n=1 Tax=Anabaena cylindrica (strain ATCC 27899 / PCC 7122) TaxID=272123 RepID=K9ZMB9_ANACC|nr:hypothetical protein Anacy_4587 [Anabaena cylindrica PCC 7122]BAY03002.1 hypothetical protein NIES19_22520 [Anabaena cylindrica PCC 7122]